MSDFGAYSGVVHMPMFWVEERQQQVVPAGATARMQQHWHPCCLIARGRLLLDRGPDGPALEWDDCFVCANCGVERMMLPAP